MSDDRKVPAIPAVRVTDPAAQRVLEALKALAETREGVHDPLDKAITLRDLASLGIVEVNLQRLGKNVTASVLPTVTGEEDSQWASIPPPEVVAFSANGLFAAIQLDWGSPIYSNHAYTEVWRASVLDGEAAPSIGDAVMVAQVTNAPWTDVPPASNDARVFYYWARNVSTAGLKSGFTAAASAMLATDPGYILSVLLGQAGSEYVEGTPLLVEVPYSTTVNGVPVAPGVYMRDLYVQNGTITNAKIGNLAVDDAKISDVTATKIKTGTLEVGQTITLDGVIRGGKTAYGSSVAGFWLGNDGGTYRFAIGDADNYMKWNGTLLEIKGTLTAPAINGATITATEFIGGEVRYGKASFSDTTQGYWLGIDDGQGKLNIGDATNFITWDGSTLAVSGLIYTSALVASEITQSVMDSSNTLVAPTFILDPATVPGLGGGFVVAAVGQPLDDVNNPPLLLCYPSKMRDTTLPAIQSGSSDVVSLGPTLATAGNVLVYGLDSPQIGKITQPASTSSRRLRASATCDPMSTSPDAISPLWVRYPVASISGTVNNRLRSYDYPDSAEKRRCANTTALLRVTVSDAMVFNYSNPAAAGNQPPPHWYVGSSSTMPFSGASAWDPSWSATTAATHLLGRLFQLFIYPPYATPPGSLAEAQALDAAAAAAYAYRPWTSGSALDPAPPGYVLDLSYFATRTGNIYAPYVTYLSGSVPYHTSQSASPYSYIHHNGIWVGPIGEVNAFSMNWSGQGWSGWTSYGGHGGSLTIVAERTIEYSGAGQNGYTAKLLHAGRVSSNPWGGLAGTIFPYATFVDYLWPHLNVRVELECDNRPFTMDTITL